MKAVRAHLAECPECAALVQGELDLVARLGSVPMVSPENDVWALIRARTRPRLFRDFGRTRVAAALAPFYRFAALATVLIVLAYSLFSLFSNGAGHTTKPDGVQTGMLVQWSDDPVGTHTSELVSFIDDM